MKNFRISFLGDISLNNEYESQYEAGGKPFKEIGSQLAKSDFVVGNLECVSRGFDGENLLKKPRLNTSVSVLNYLRDINLNLALLANNHIYDNLKSGFDRTINFLEEHKIAYIGAGHTLKDARKPYFKEVGNETFVILNYVSKDTNPNIPIKSNFYVNWFNIKNVRSDILRYSKFADKVILCLHWGGKCEGGFYPDWPQAQLAHSLVDCGADLIIGSHSHTFQPYEKYSDKMIYYSLGNFCFSDIIFEDKIIELDRDKRTDSAIVNLDIKRNNWSYNLVPFNFDNLDLVIDYNLMEEFKSRNIKFHRYFRYKFFWDMYFFKFKFIDPILFYLLGNGKDPIKQIKKLDIFKIINFLLTRNN